jgi:hypothetical protein
MDWRLYLKLAEPVAGKSKPLPTPGDRKAPDPIEKRAIPNPPSPGIDIIKFLLLSFQPRDPWHAVCYVAKTGFSRRSHNAGDRHSANLIVRNCHLKGGFHQLDSPRRQKATFFW